MKVTQNRLDLMDTVTVDEVDEKDPLTLQLRDFEMTREATRHQVLQRDVFRPDLVAAQEYNSSGFWWFILAVNGIIDPYALPEGDFLKVPSLLDYYDFFREQKES